MEVPPFAPGGPNHDMAEVAVRAYAPVEGDLGPDLPGEPVVVGKPGATEEDDAWLLTLVHRAEARRTDLYVLDAADLSTVARLPLPHHQPPGFHGCFVPAGS